MVVGHIDKQFHSCKQIFLLIFIIQTKCVTTGHFRNDTMTFIVMDLKRLNGSNEIEGRVASSTTHDDQVKPNQPFPKRGATKRHNTSTLSNVE